MATGHDTVEETTNASDEKAESKKVLKAKAVLTEETVRRTHEAEKVKLLALLKAIREEMNQPVIRGLKVRDFADIFVDRYNFFYDMSASLFPGTDFRNIFARLEKGTTSLEKIRMEITLLIAYVQNDIMDIIEQSERLKQKNKWLQDRLREFEIKIAGIQAIR